MIVPLAAMADVQLGSSLWLGWVGSTRRCGLALKPALPLSLASFGSGPRRPITSSSGEGGSAHEGGSGKAAGSTAVPTTSCTLMLNMPVSMKMRASPPRRKRSQSVRSFIGTRHASHSPTPEACGAIWRWAFVNHKRDYKRAENAAPNACRGFDLGWRTLLACTKSGQGSVGTFMAPGSDGQGNTGMTWMDSTSRVHTQSRAG